MSKWKKTCPSQSKTVLVQHTSVHLSLKKAPCDDKAGGGVGWGNCKESRELLLKIKEGRKRSTVSE